MSNQNNSHRMLQLNGSIGPVKQMWQNFLANHTDNSLTEVQKHNMQAVFYIAAAQMYETLISCVKQDHSMNLLAQMSQAMHKDFETFFASDDRNPISTH